LVSSTDELLRKLLCWQKAGKRCCEYVAEAFFRYVSAKEGAQSGVSNDFIGMCGKLKNARN